MSFDGRYLIASKRVARGEVPVRHILFYGVNGSDTGFLLLEHVDGHEDDELGVMCFDCALDLTPDGRALEIARHEGEWHADGSAPWVLEAAGLHE